VSNDVPHTASGFQRAFRIPNINEVFIFIEAAKRRTPCPLQQANDDVNAISLSVASNLSQ